MEIISKEFKVYEFHELEERAQERAFDKWYEGAEFGWNTEYQDTLEEFCRIFDVECYNWSVDQNTYYFSARVKNSYPICYDDSYAQNIRQKIRLSKYITRILSGKTDISLTGFCADYDVLDPYYRVTKWENLYTCYEDFIRDCLSTFFYAWERDIENSYSMENFTENYANEHKYLENGDTFYE
jgi:hypothetical protein